MALGWQPQRCSQDIRCFIPSSRKLQKLLVSNARLMLRETPTVGVLGPVYIHTPPEQRGKGFGYSVARGVSAVILQQRRYACLFADDWNPTSNRIYEKIGYQKVGKAVAREGRGALKEIHCFIPFPTFAKMQFFCTRSWRSVGKEP